MKQDIINKNPKINFVDSSPLFIKHSYDTKEVIDYSEKLSPTVNNQYIGSDNEAEKLDILKKISIDIFAEAKLQFGFCFGGSRKMNGMEWHKSSEFIIACTDMVLLLGSYGDIIDETYKSENAVGVYLQKGECIELLPMTLHLAPLAVDDYFKAAIILPEHTNEPLVSGINGTRRAKNKWLILHEENKVGISLGGKIGIIGENISLNV